MERKYEIKPKGHKVDIPFSSDEATRFRSFLQATGRKAGPWVRLIALKAIEEADASGEVAP